MHCFGDRGIRLHAGLIHDILYEKRADERFSDGYDIASEAMCFLCDYMNQPLGKIIAVNSKGKELTIRDMCFKTVFRYINSNQKHESNIIHLDQPNLREMSVPFESESTSEEHSADANAIMRKIGLTEKEKYTLKLIMKGMNPYRVSKHLKMSNHGIYNRVYRAIDKYVKVYGVPASCNLQF